MGNQLHVTNITPIPKPRMTRRDQWMVRDCVKKYWGYKDCLKLESLDQKFVLGNNIRMFFVIPMARTWSKKRKLETDKTRHQNKPDIDNLVKAVMDSLKEKDETVHTIFASKSWGYEGSISIENL